MFSISQGGGWHYHITSLSYPNVLVLCIQMEAFILPLLGLHPSNVHLTGIPMFPATAVCLKSVKSSVDLANRLLQNTVRVALQRKVLFSRDGLTPISLVSGKVGGLQVSIYTILLAKEKCILVQGGCATQKSSWGQFHSLAGKSSCSTAPFPFESVSFWWNHEEQHVHIHTVLAQLWWTELNRKNGQIECVPARWWFPEFLNTHVSALLMCTPCAHSCTTMWLNIYILRTHTQTLIPSCVAGSWGSINAEIIYEGGLTIAPRRSQGWRAW